MKRLIKRKSGLGENYLKTLEGDTVTVYHGTGAQNYEDILENGLIDGGGTSYQLVSQMTQSGVWVTLDKNIAMTYAKQAAQGYVNEGNDDDFTGYGVIFEFTLDKNILSDEGSGVRSNFKVIEPITSDIINAGHAYIINLDDSSEYQSF